MADNTTKTNLIAKVLFIAGGIILFILLAVFILRLVPVAISNIANVGTSIKTGITKTLTGGEEIIISTNTPEAEVGKPLIVNFVYSPTEPGQYYVSYSCFDGLFYDIQSSNGAKRLICNTPFKLGDNLDAISLIPIVTKKNILIDSTITIEYKDSESNPVAKGTKIITIKSEGGSASATSTDENQFNANNSLSGSKITTSSVTPKTTTTTGTIKSYVSKNKDLAITEAYRIDDQSAFVFHVYNLGNTSTGPWDFAYTDAENPSKTISSPVQASLAGGQGLAVTVRFDGQDNSNQVIALAIDPYNQINESNESNNSGSVTITGDRSGNNNSGNGSYDSNDDADLVITRMEVGRLSGNRFVSDDEIEDNDTAAVRFIVKNQGGESTGSWRFQIDNLPYDRDDKYESKSYSSLRPGQSIEVVADFDGIDDGRYSIKVEVDSDDDVDEENERNNTESETLEVDN